MREIARRRARLKGEAGYTLTEMLVVIGIICLIAATLTPMVAAPQTHPCSRFSLDDIDRPPTAAAPAAIALLGGAIGLLMAGLLSGITSPAPALRTPGHPKLRLADA